MHGTHLFRVASLSLLMALGLTVFAAAGFQPEALAANGVFKVSGKSVPAGLGVKFSAAPEGQATFAIPNLNIEIVCSKFLTFEGELAPEGIATEKLLYEGCQMWVIEGSKAEHKLTEPFICEVKGAVLDALLLVVSHEGQTYLLAEGKKNAKGETLPLMTVEIANEKKCPFGGVMTFRGSEAFELTVGDLQKGPELEELLIRPGGPTVQELLKDKFVYGTQPVIAEGGVKLALTGAHQNLAWGVI
jgi:hypothetical protein